MRFKSYWRMTVAVALFLHFIVWTLLAIILPHLHFEEQPPPAQEMEVVDIPEGDDSDEQEETKQPEPEKQPKPEPEQQPEPEQPPDDIIPQELSPTEAAEMDEAVAEIQKGDAAAGRTGKNGLPPAPPTQQIGALVVSGNTPDTRGTDFRGTVGILVKLDETGHITGYRFTQTSGRRVVDQLVLNAVHRFQFEPALDTEGHPMKTMRLLRFPFDGSGSHPFDDDENKRIRANKQLVAAKQMEAEKQAAEDGVPAN